MFTGEGAGQQAFNAARPTWSTALWDGGSPATTTSQARRGRHPFAVNAVVVGVLGGYPNLDPQWPENVPKAYDDVKVTMPELATSFGQGRFAFTEDDAAALQERNPQLPRRRGREPLQRFAVPPAGGEAASWFASNAVRHLGVRPVEDRVAGGRRQPAERPAVRQRFARAADPPFAPALFSLYSNRSGLQKVVAANEFLPGNYGPIWILTDLATATLLRSRRWRYRTPRASS